MDGKDLHIGDFEWGILPPTAPLAISSTTIAGIAMAFALERSGRVALSFIGEGGSSLGEWHEAINLCAVHRLPAVFCVENNQMALSTSVREQSAVRVFADKAAGYGVPGITIDGTDPDAIAAAFTWAADRARAGEGPGFVLCETYRYYGHHVGDVERAYYRSKEEEERWKAERDPIGLLGAWIVEQGFAGEGDLERVARDAEAEVAAAAEHALEAPFPDPGEVDEHVYAG